MVRDPSWRELRVGLACTALLAALTFGILVFGRLGRLPGDTYRIFVRADEARGLIKGSDVWLNGQKIGAVREISFLPPEAGPRSRLLLEIEVLERHREAIRTDSRVEIRSGGSLIGAPVVFLSLGSPTAPVVAAGDTIVAREQVDLEAVASNYAEAAGELPLIAKDLEAIVTLMRSPDGTLGALMEERGASGSAEVRARLAALAGRFDGGTLGQALGGRAPLVARARRVMAQVDSIRALLGSGATSLGRFRRDSTLALTIADVRNELSIVRALLDEPRGTLGRAGRDSAIVNELAAIEREMTALFADVKRRPFRYLSF